MTTPQYAVLVPVKPPAHGKSRLVGPPADVRRDLAAAFALDTVEACLAAGRVGAVLAVTDDAHFSRHLASLGCDSIPDGVTGDLNATLRQAAAEVRRRWPELATVAVCADLPALRADDLDAALTQASTHQASFVADASGLGTTLYAAAPDLFDPRFGLGSCLAHLGTGAVAIEGPLASLRRDVDDLEDLREAMELGLGPHTREAVAGSEMR